MRFADRPEAGRALAARLTAYANRADVVVLGLARGGVPVAAEVARALAAPLDVLLVRKLGAPDQPELAIGAIAEDGVALVNEDVLRGLGLARTPSTGPPPGNGPSWIVGSPRIAAGGPGIAVDGRVAIVVDDGLATGASMEAACRTLAARGAARLVVAVPVASREACDRLRTIAHEVVAVATPAPFYAVGAWYVDFRQTDDREVVDLLAARHAIEFRRRALPWRSPCSRATCPPGGRRRSRSSVLLSGLPALAAAAEPGAPAPSTRSATPIADAARAAVDPATATTRHDDNAALKWTGFGLIAGGGSLIAIGAVIDNEDCFDNGITYYDCDDVRKAAYVAGGIMAGVGVGLMLMASHSGHRGHGRYPSITMQRGRMLVQQQIRF